MIIPDYNDGTIFVHLDKNDIIKCNELASLKSKWKKWGDNKKKGDYPSGDANSSKDTIRAERAGEFGEISFSKITGIPFDETQREHGDDGWDFKTKSFTIDVKCHLKFYDILNIRYGEFFVKAHKKKDKYIPPKADYIVFSTFYCSDSHKKDNFETRDCKEAIIKFYGAIKSEDLFKNYKERLGESIRKGSTYKNYFVKKSELIPMIDFVSQFKNDLMTKKSGVII